ncbi:MAG: hypothetical protein VKL60_20680 [Sphaerospermopsis sp.]|nr:hypothetical protein [Sphaerospermopsis sp.]
MPEATAASDLERAEHQPTTNNQGLKKVLGYGYDGSSFIPIKLSPDGSIETDSSEFAINVQVDSGDSAVYYIGKAAIGSLTSEAVWQISRVDESTGTVIEWADGDGSFNNIFDNREALTYA